MVKTVVMMLTLARLEQKGAADYDHGGDDDEEDDGDNDG